MYKPYIFPPKDVSYRHIKRAGVYRPRPFLYVYSNIFGRKNIWLINFNWEQPFLSGSLTQEGDITADSSDVIATDVSASANFLAGGDLTIAGNSIMTGSLSVSGEIDLAASGVSTSIRGGLTVDEDSLFNSI